MMFCKKFNYKQLLFLFLTLFAINTFGQNSELALELLNKVSNNLSSFENINFQFRYTLENKTENTIRVLKGPQFHYFSKESQKDFFSREYKISNLTDRMGMRLEGTIIKNVVNTNIRSEGITKGAIQVPADGQPIILLTDYPTIGGYPKIANVASVDYNFLIQKIPGDKIFFKLISLHEAEQLYKEHINNISQIIKNINELN